MLRVPGICAVLAALLGVAWTVPARAAAELSLGALDDIEGKSAPIATLAWVGETRHPWELLVAHLGSRDGEGLSRTPTSTFLAVSKRLRWRGFFASSGIALADHDRDNRVLSGPLQFLTGLGWANERWTISLRHISNADTVGVNRGETFLLVGYRF